VNGPNLPHPIAVRSNCSCRKHYEPAANNLLSGERVCWTRLEFNMQNRVNCIDPVHTRAITTEIGERLRLFFSKEQPEPASSLQTLITRLSELDKDSPSIVPDPVQS
jgi:hypothetical protein